MSESPPEQEEPEPMRDPGEEPAPAEDEEPEPVSDPHGDVALEPEGA